VVTVARGQVGEVARARPSGARNATPDGRSSGSPSPSAGEWARASSGGRDGGSVRLSVESATPESRSGGPRPAAPAEPSAGGAGSGPAPLL